MFLKYLRCVLSQSSAKVLIVWGSYARRQVQAIYGEQKTVVLSNGSTRHIYYLNHPESLMRFCKWEDLQQNSNTLDEIGKAHDNVIIANILLDFRKQAGKIKPKETIDVGEFLTLMENEMKSFWSRMRRECLGRRRDLPQGIRRAGTQNVSPASAAQPSTLVPEPADSADPDQNTRTSTVPRSTLINPIYAGLGVVNFNLTLELIKTPVHWPPTAMTPDQLGIDKICIPIRTNIPSLGVLIDYIHDKYDPVDKGFQVTMLYWWESVRGRDKKTGQLVDKTTKVIITGDADLQAYFSLLTVSETPELFFELTLRGTSQLIHDIDPTPPPLFGYEVSNERQLLQLRV